MAFDVQVARPIGLGVAWRLDVTFDDWASLAYRFVDRLGLWAHSALEELAASRGYDFSSWTADQVTRTAGILAPDGSSHATRITDNTSNAEHRLYLDASLANERGMRASKAFVYFAIAKAETLGWISLRNISGAKVANFNLVSGETGRHSADVDPRMLSLGAGWWLCSAAFPAVGGGQFITVNVSEVDTGTAATYAYVGTGKSLLLHEAGAIEDFEQTPRLAAMGQLSRAFGEDRVASPASVSVSLNNEDGALDGLMDTWTNTLKMRVRPYVGLYEPGQKRCHWKQLGEYRCDDMPARNGRVLTFGLQDSLSSVATYRAPSLKDWYDGDVLCPMHWYPQERLEAITNHELWTRPLPLCFGDNPIGLTFFPTLYGTKANNSGQGTPDSVEERRNQGVAALVICATRNDDAFTDGGDGVTVWAEFIKDAGLAPDELNTSSPAETQELAKGNTLRSLPKKSDLNGRAWTAWNINKSGPIAVDGKLWYILWVAVDVLGVAAQMQSATGSSGSRYIKNHDESEDMPFEDDVSGVRLNGKPNPAGDRYYNEIGKLFEGVQRAWVSTHRHASHVDTVAKAQRHPVDVLSDLAKHYSPIGPNVDTERLEKLRATDPQRQAYLQLSQPPVSEASRVSVGFLEELSDFAQSSDIDVFMTMDGKLAAVASNETFDSATTGLPHFYEHELAGVHDSSPSREQRGAYYNRLVLDFEPSPLLDEALAKGLPAPTKGPFDNRKAVVPVTTRAYVKRLNARWTPRVMLRQDPWTYRAVESYVRKRIRFSTGLKALTLELGDYFSLDWSRGGATLYEGTVWQLVAATLSPESGMVDVEALWSGDLRLNRPYLLDQESLSLRAKLASRDITLTCNSSAVAFGGGSLVDEGVSVGDILVLRDDVAGVWRRFAAYRITALLSSTSLQVTADDLDYSWDLVGGTIVLANAKWAIYRGATTAHTGASDAVNYPYGSDAYGKVTNVADAGTYSNANPGHLLKE